MSTGQLRGVVSRIERAYTAIRVDGKDVAEHLRWHTHVHGSINQCPPDLRRVGQAVLLEYRTTASYGLWFVVGPAT